MRTDKYHIRVNGQPACLRGMDGEAMLDHAHRHHIWIGCSHIDRAAIEACARVMRDFHPDWTVEIVEGGCTAEPYDPYMV